MVSRTYQSDDMDYYDMRILPHLDPVSTGQAAWRVRKSPSPLRSKLYHTAALPLRGVSATLMRGNTVAPPWGTSLI